MHPTHNEHAISAAILTVSDTRTEKTDSSGLYIHEALSAASFSIQAYLIEKDEPLRLIEHIKKWCQNPSINTIIVTGGSGFSPRDQSFEALTPLFEKEMTGFGELFRSLSYDAIGPKAMFSRATAGCRQQTAIYLIPGSKNAVTLAMKQLIIPTVQHFVGELNRP
ncbi:MogA/MoaB family molybdenum cofactor biosynthesis protein [Kurthia sibirica]|uniref:Molybdenum cofactor biosynthesis protein B n=1 Tax=Kurthia sibirica TaxID=202750 RepID=A0A2U3AKS6_9BACL|nr:MogA/MoaB family molybdenum cofactor biosynthesis protein [Kurthia sibirica]PWI25133.1 molybdenum cofactor biosynthesis protein [Kurthia sibirica]